MPGRSSLIFFIFFLKKPTLFFLLWKEVHFHQLTFLKKEGVHLIGKFLQEFIYESYIVLMYMFSSTVQEKILPEKERS